MQNGWDDFINFYLRIKIDTDSRLLITKGFFRFFSIFYRYEGNIYEDKDGITRISLDFKISITTILIIVPPLLFGIGGIAYTLFIDWSIGTFCASLMPFVFLLIEMGYIAYNKSIILKQFMQFFNLEEEAAN